MRAESFELIMVIESPALHEEETGEICMKARGIQRLVRCKNCIHWGATLTEEERAATAANELLDSVCDYHMSDGFCGNDFCSFGMRREEADDKNELETGS